MKVLFSSVKTTWRTPKAFYDQLNREFHFTLDPCPSGRHKTNGLKRKWGKRNYVNPPYNPKNIKQWLTKAISENRQYDSLSVFLLPVRTDTRWFHDLVLPHAKEIRFVRGRLKFSGHKNYAPFPSMVVVIK